ncbi:ATP-dependent RNA helicase DbpA [Motiliproteus sp. MSK22-1]|uniref:ATP-dependent RNA helicase DbpA n=1 Tax=Motiliproteus sp. MSK22-1 TaxID=1897630 RepID=UPI0009766646|nr:ATP-dependent RNA helicase DbpA [Motiliproteus sp. MSK22-1]OMH25287.1 ATP-dependent RNA helicase DbpA [Motiliproteus sp. MSK22-1]
MTDQTTSLDFASLKLPKAQLENLNTLGYQQMTPIQAKSLPSVIAGEDLIAKAKTGSGKTAAFGIGMLESINPRFFAPQCLVLCPTRELSTQVATELRRLARYRQNLKVLTLCGGQPIGPQIGSLAHGAHIVVGTPGRIADHLRKKTLDLANIRTLVLDEADRMLDMGFIEAIEGILVHTPDNRQTLLFSATYPEQIRILSQNFQSSPVEVSVESVHQQTQIQQFFYSVNADNKLKTLIDLLGHFRPVSTAIFCNTKQRCNDVSEFLQQQGYYALALHGDLDQKERDQVLVQFSNQSSSILVATDVAARGLDIDDLAAVINFELSRQADVYVHRIGRTGRAGKEGLALSLYSDSESYKLAMIEEYIGQDVIRKTSDELKSASRDIPKPRMTTICVGAGRRQKVRPGDILGALTGDAGIAGDQVGKINVFENWTYVAITKKFAEKALGRLINGKIKGRKFKVRKL